MDELRIRKEIEELEKIRLSLDKQLKKAHPLLKTVMQKKAEDINNLIKALSLKEEYLKEKLKEAEIKKGDLEIRKRISSHLEQVDIDTYNIVLSEDIKKNFKEIMDTVGARGKHGSRSKLPATKFKVVLNNKEYTKFIYVRDQIYGMRNYTLEQFIEEITKKGAKVTVDENKMIIYITDPHVKP